MLISKIDRYKVFRILKMMWYKNYILTKVFKISSVEDDTFPVCFIFAIIFKRDATLYSDPKQGRNVITTQESPPA